MRPFAVLVVLLSFTHSLFAADLKPANDTSIVYGSGKNTRQVLDVFLPSQDETTFPVIFMIHGGGYVFGDKLFLAPAVHFFVEQGYAVVTPNYRLAPSHPYPDPLDDIFCAYAWTLSNAETYGLDLSRLTVMGESAGANGAAMLAAVDDPTPYLTDCPSQIPADVHPKAAVLYYPPMDLSTCECRTAKELAALYLGMDGYDPKQEDEMRKRGLEASPLPWLDGSEPPFLLFHGAEDTLIPPSESELFVQAVTDAGGTAQLTIVPKMSHGFFTRPAYPETQKAWQETADFLASIEAGPKKSG